MLYRIVGVFLVVLIFFASSAFPEYEEDAGAGSFLPGLAVGGGAAEVDYGICPQGANVINAFLVAWQKDNLKRMYDLLDDSYQQSHPFEDVRFDLMMLEFKTYAISSIRKSGENFEFILTYGDYRDNNKDTLKATISGKTFKIIPTSSGQVFKRSADSYF